MDVNALKPKCMVFAILALCGAYASGHASDECPDTSNAQPATLLDEDNQKAQISQLLRDWRTEESTRIVQFGARVTKSGRISSDCCYSFSFRKNWLDRRNLRRAIPKLRFEPASINGENVQVWVNITIVGRKSDDGYETEVYLNHLHSADLFGNEYSSPQRIWYRRGIGLWRKRFSEETFVDIEAIVDKFGIASDLKLTYRNGSRNAGDDYNVDESKAVCFIPGFANGTPTEMPYFEGYKN